MSERLYLNMIVSAINLAQSLSRGTNGFSSPMVPWVYRVEYPSGRIGYWVRFASQPERHVDGFDLDPVVGYRNGHMILP